MMRHLLWIDSAAGALVGTVVLLASEGLSGLYGLPLVTGAANVLYAACSGSLAMRAVRPRAGIAALVAANAVWAVVCVGLVGAYAEGGGGLGLLHLGAEAVFVGGLAALEWRHRDALRVA